MHSRACLQLSRMITKALWTSAENFLTSFSQRVTMARMHLSSLSLKKRSTRLLRYRAQNRVSAVSCCEAFGGFTWWYRTEQNCRAGAIEYEP